MIHPAKILQSLSQEERELWLAYQQAKHEKEEYETKHQRYGIIENLLRDTLTLIDQDQPLRDNEFIQGNKETLRQTRRTIRALRNEITMTHNSRQYNKLYENIQNTFSKEEIEILENTQILIDEINRSIED